MSVFFKTKEEIEQWLDSCSIYSYVIHDDLTVDVDDSVILSVQELTQLPVKFGKILGDFDCSLNYLTDLKNSPYYVGRNFDCENCDLESLEGSPRFVGGGFDCSHNKLKNLIGGPDEVLGDYNCSSNLLETLDGLPEKAVDWLYLEDNNLTSFNGITANTEVPTTIDCDFFDDPDEMLKEFSTYYSKNENKILNEAVNDHLGAKDLTNKSGKRL